MTEAEWLECTEPEKMLKFLKGKASDRKVRLFACACVRRAWLLLTDAGRQAVEAAEAYADGRIDRQTLKAASCAAHKPVDEEIEAANISGHGFRLSPPLSAADAAFEASNSMDSDITRHLVPINAVRAAQDALGSAGGECAAQAVLLRDILSNPFRPITLNPDWLTWHDGLLVSMARRMYDSRDFTDMPVLADALEEAGCQDQDILGHCRSGGEHVRGCWVVDLLLGKE